MARKIGSHADITGPRVRDAALKLFARHGFASVTMRQIASEVGVQAGALYLYTPDKQTLLFDLLHEHMQEVLNGWAAEDQTGAPVERLETFTRFHIRFHLERRDAVFISYMELRSLSPENFAKLETLRRRYEDALEEILVDGQKLNHFEVADTKLTTLAIIAMLNGVTNWYRPDGRLSLVEVEALFSEMVGKAVRLPGHRSARKTSAAV